VAQPRPYHFKGKNYDEQSTMGFCYAIFGIFWDYGLFQGDDKDLDSAQHDLRFTLQDHPT